jgi:hypothetical protein
MRIPGSRCTVLDQYKVGSAPTIEGVLTLHEERIPPITMVRLGMLAACLSVLNGCSGPCASREISRAEAPDGLHKAVMFQRNCGATTGFSTQISVLAPDEEPPGVGNAFRADDDHGAAVAGGWGGPWAEMRWIDNGTLLIRYASESRIFEQSRQVSGVQIRYQKVVFSGEHRPGQ